MAFYHRRYGRDDLHHTDCADADPQAVPDDKPPAAAQIKRGSDITSAHIVSRVLKILIVIVVFLFYGEHFGMSLSGLLTFGGIGGIAIGMAGKDILSNLFSGIMLYLTARLKLVTGSVRLTGR